MNAQAIWLNEEFAVTISYRSDFKTCEVFQSIDDLLEAGLVCCFLYKNTNEICKEKLYILETIQAWGKKIC